jgi:hypothetical protein
MYISRLARLTFGWTVNFSKRDLILVFLKLCGELFISGGNIFAMRTIGRKTNIETSGKKEIAMNNVKTRENKRGANYLTKIWPAAMADS